MIKIITNPVSAAKDISDSFHRYRLDSETLVISLQRHIFTTGYYNNLRNDSLGIKTYETGMYL